MSCKEVSAVGVFRAIPLQQAGMFDAMQYLALPLTGAAKDTLSCRSPLSRIASKRCFGPAVFDEGSPCTPLPSSVTLNLELRPSSEEDAFIGFYRSFLLFQRKNGYVFSAWNALSLIEHQLLLEVDQSMPKRPCDLAERLNYPISQLTHVQASLRGRSLVRVVPGETNREKLLMITPAGRALLWNLDDVSNSRMNEFVNGAECGRQVQLYQMWELLNNVLDAPRSVVRPGDHPLRFQTRRFTRAIGCFSRNSSDSTLSYPDIQILDCIRMLSSCATLDALHAHFAVPRATLKNRLIRLAEQELCSRPSERTEIPVRLTSAGETALWLDARHFSARAAALFPRASADRFAEMAASFHSLVQEWSPVTECPTRVSSSDASEDSIFLRFQVEALVQYARQNFGILPPATKDKDSISPHTVVMFEGPTPSFTAKLRWSGPKNAAERLIIDEFGSTSRTDWSRVSTCLEEYVGTLPRNKRGLDVVQLAGSQTPPRVLRPPESRTVELSLGLCAEPLRSLLR